MKKLTMFLTVLALAIMPMIGFSSIHAYDINGVDLGNQVNFRCYTGLTCTIVGGQLRVVSSPTLTGTSLSLSSTLGVTGATTLSSTAHIVGAATLDSTASIAGLATLTGGALGDGSKNIVGFLQKQVLATATTITAAQCGSTFINSGAVRIVLPAASGVVGCRLSFIVANASNFDVSGGAGDQITVVAPTNGHAARNSTVGDSISVQAYASGLWAVVGIQGSWSDQP